MSERKVWGSSEQHRRLLAWAPGNRPTYSGTVGQWGRSLRGGGKDIPHTTAADWPAPAATMSQVVSSGAPDTHGR